MSPFFYRINKKTSALIFFFICKIFTVDAQCNQYSIFDIHIYGNHKTKEKNIRHELLFHENDTVNITDWNQLKLRSKERLEDLELFVDVKIKDTTDAACRTSVEIYVTERWYIYPLVLVELADRNFNEWWDTYDHDWKRINIGLWYYHRNLTGRGDNLLVGYQTGFTHKGSLRYNINGLGKNGKWNAEYNIHLSTEKKVAYRTFQDKLDFYYSDRINRRRFFTGVTLSYRPRLNQKHVFDATFHQYSISDRLQELNTDYISSSGTEQNFLTLYYAFEINNRDSKVYPKIGYNFRNEILRIGILPKDAIHLTSLKSNLNIYTPLAKNIYFGAGYTYRHLISDERPSYYLYRALGYKEEFVRGYQLYVIDGEKYFLNRNNLKYRFFNRKISLPIQHQRFKNIPVQLYLKGLLDVGYVWTQQPYQYNKLNNKPLYGYGIGLDIESIYSIVVRFEYSVNSMNEKALYLHFKTDIGADNSHIW